VNTLSVVLTIVVLLAVAVFILAFERRRAREIQRDLREQRGGPDDGSPPDQASTK